VDPGVKYLEDPYLSEYTLGDFPRVDRFEKNGLTPKPR
jgi:hypothetical protein